MNAKDFYRQRHCGIYRIHNTDNDMSYIGQSVDCSARWQQHLTKNKSAIGSAIALSPASFTFQIMELCSKELLNEREKHYIQVYDCVWPNGYNKTYGGSKGVEFSEDTKQKLGSNKHSQETKDKISKALKGRKTKPFTKKHKQNMLIAARELAARNKAAKTQTLLEDFTTDE